MQHDVTHIHNVCDRKELHNYILSLNSYIMSLNASSVSIATCMSSTSLSCELDSSPPQPDSHAYAQESGSRNYMYICRDGVMVIIIVSVRLQ